ncbi:hypothetical protein AJ80_03431 [Polytolypa hystricis UAMH7299]|uniref:Major facilitator superfamily (MFS) profile domain-containing protein n=1 Tax=Polytolypa hystricis (strain UAMH7299) TaxID=1447883 RepID=A0A2B7Y9R1_POLH7|nr:hypothetical protein AJ80_03431 [Polytolypa hystricis UAMH7299]
MSQSPIGDAEKTCPPSSAESVKQLQDEDTPLASEWNRRSILTIIGTSCFLFCTLGLVNAFGIFQAYYSETFFTDKSLSAISWFGSFNAFCMFAGAVVTGVLSDIYGPKWIIRAGSVMVLVGLFMTSLCTEYYQFFLAQGLLFGFGVACIFLPAFATTSLYFTKYRALALGITIGGSSLGGVIWPIAIRRLLVEVGFGWAMRTAAFIMVPLLGIGCLTVRLPEHKKRGEKKPKPNMASMKTGAFGLLTCFMFFAAMGLFVPFFFITSYAISIGMDPDMSFYLISILNGTSLFGRVLPGILADRYGRFNVMVLATLFSGIICCCMTAATSMGGIIVIAAAYGFSSGAILSLQGACATQLVDPQTYGAAMGMMMGICSIPSLFGSPIAGELASRYGFLATAEYGGATLLLAAAFAAASRLTQNSKLLAVV